MTNKMHVIAIVLAAIWAAGYGCQMFEGLTLEDVGRAGEVIQGTTDALADSDTPPPSNVLKGLAIVGQYLSALAFGLMSWRLRRNSKKED